MTAPVRRTTVPSAVGENRRRIQILEAVPPDGMMGVFVERLATQSIPDNTLTSIEFDTVIYEYGADWVDLGVSTTDVTLPVSGMYVMQGQTRWAAHVTTPGQRRTTQITSSINGVIATYDSPSIDVAIDIDMNTSFCGYRTAGDVIHLRVLQDSSGALDVIAFGLSIVLITADTS